MTLLYLDHTIPGEIPVVVHAHELEYPAHSNDDAHQGFIERFKYDPTTDPYTEIVLIKPNLNDKQS